MKYSEADFQAGRILGFFTDKLQWKEDIQSLVDKTRWLVKSDIQWFLKHGNSANSKAFNNLIKHYGSDEELVLDFIDTALLPKITIHINSASVLREQIAFKGQIFTLFNEPNVVGSSADADSLFDKNVFKVVPEATFEKKYDGRRFNRRPDLTFFINGIYFSYSELKLSTQGQSASNQGREKIAHNFIEAVSASIDHVLVGEGYSLDNRPSWTDISSRASVYHKILQEMSLFTKAVHITTVDDSQVYIINDIAKFVPEIYDALRLNLKSDSTRLLKEILPEKIKRAFNKMSQLREKTLTQSVMINLESLYLRESIYSEIEYFNSYNRDGKHIRPRAAQRSMFFSTKRNILSQYT